MNPGTRLCANKLASTPQPLCFQSSLSTSSTALRSSPRASSSTSFVFFSLCCRRFSNHFRADHRASTLFRSVPGWLRAARVSGGRITTASILRCHAADLCPRSTPHRAWSRAVPFRSGDIEHAPRNRPPPVPFEVPHPRAGQTGCVADRCVPERAHKRRSAVTAIPTMKRTPLVAGPRHERFAAGPGTKAQDGFHARCRKERS